MGKAPTCAAFLSVTAKPIGPGADPRLIVELLKAELTKPVLWARSVRGMVDFGGKEFYEVGAGSRLKFFMQFIDEAVWADMRCMEA
eukprot:NODE_6271_length_518_cov_152.982721.p4 GENE.NODE_6271_length_518_cov_152.982721~~NODE_6271_length_518_cov_152.982721.p4  ORF type:complete len:86 (+),score=22.38 NODE_6271_length_518_cov_152.982721:3-260(+)